MTERNGGDIVMAEAAARVEQLEAELAAVRKREAALAVRNAHLGAELARRDRDLSEALMQQAATGRLLQVVSESHTSTQPVFDAIVASAVSLCDGVIGVVYLFDGELITLAAELDVLGQREWATLQSLFPMPPDRGTAFGRAILTRAVVHIADVGVDRRFPELQRIYGYRSILVTPMLHKGAAIGAIGLFRQAAEPFSDRQLELLRTFADQAVIAIENTRLFEELQEKSRELEITSKHKSEFLASMSHELRTPLNAIIGYSEMLQEAAEDLGEASLLPDLQKINAAGKHLLGLINDILDLSKIEAGKMDLFLETFDVGQLVDDVAAIVQPLVDKNANTLIVQCSNDAGEMHADLTKVRQALFNLLSNASKFTDHGTITLRVSRGEGTGNKEQEADLDT